MENRSREERPGDDAFVKALERVGGGDFTTKFPDDSGALAEAFNKMVDHLRVNEKIRDTFGISMSQQVFDAILSGNVKLGGESKTVTVLVAEIREYESLAESISPEELVEIVNRYLEVASECVQANDGVVDHFHHGWGLTVIFGSPIRNELHAAKAVACGVQLRQRMMTLEQGEPAIHLDIGIATGPVVCGNIGSEARMEYTVLGGAVVRAEHLKDQARESNTRLLVSPATAAEAGNAFHYSRLSESGLTVDSQR